MVDFPIARMKDGSLYEGNTMFKGNGILKWCAICTVHKPTGGGYMKAMMGGRHWVCSKHLKVVK